VRLSGPSSVLICTKPSLDLESPEVDRPMMKLCAPVLLLYAACATPDSLSSSGCEPGCCGGDPTCCDITACDAKATTSPAAQDCPPCDDDSCCEPSSDCCAQARIE
jgi:hypothetical protein